MARIKIFFLPHNVYDDEGIMNQHENMHRFVLDWSFCKLCSILPNALNLFKIHFMHEYSIQ